LKEEVRLKINRKTSDIGSLLSCIYPSNAALKLFLKRVENYA